MKRFHTYLANLSIKRKIVAISFLTSTLALSLACLAFFANEALTVRSMLERDLVTQAEVIARNCGAALAFNDPSAGRETLQSLDSKPNVICAFLLAADGRLFADYSNARYPEEVPAAFKAWLSSINPAILAGLTAIVDEESALPFHQGIFRPIVIDGERVGTIFIASDLSPLFERLSFYGAISLLVMLIASSIAWLLASRLQGHISKPIMELARTMSSVSREENYSLRSRKVTDDEIGVLIDQFNHMLAKIEERDLMLNERGEHLRKLAHFDPLTDLPNRVLIFDRLAQAILQAGRTSRNLAVMFIDLDQFKDVNDSLGHRTGDRLLQEVSSRLKATLRESDNVGRLGGDEFIVFLPEDPGNIENVAIVAQKLIDTFSEPIAIDGREVFITASVGIALYPFDGDTAEELIKNADLAMYHVKEQGKNHFQFFSQELQQRACSRLDLHNRLRRALEREEFVLLYQPKIDLETRAICGLEALIRWDSPDEGTIPPAQFIPVAEETGLIVQIGDWVLRSVCRQLMAWQKEGREPIRVAVNVSPVQFKRQNMAEKVAQILEYTGLDPSLLELEITETAIMHINEETLADLWSLKGMGVHIVIDDFGTGFSSLSYLRRMPVDTLKIDRSFIQNSPQSKEDTFIIKAILGLGQSLNLQVVAEGVETEEQLSFLQEHGCHQVQGFLCGALYPAEVCGQILLSPAMQQVV